MLKRTRDGVRVKARKSCRRNFKDGKIDWLRFKQPRRACKSARLKRIGSRDAILRTDSGVGTAPGGLSSELFGVPEDKAQDNFTDPESRIMKLGGSFEQCYNAQAVVDADSQLVVASGLTNNAADNGELVPMVEVVKENLGELPNRVLGDSGFRSEDGFAKLEQV